MLERDWVSVGQYNNLLDAQLVSERLSMEGVPNQIFIPQIQQIQRPVGPISECYVWVPPEAVEDAKRILAEFATSEAELTDLALKYLPPDDYER
jgi:hypothetical protein